MGGLKNTEKVLREIKQIIYASTNAIKDGLAKVGLECVNIARSVPYTMGFQDQTGALRSSIGFAVFHDGQCVTENFEQIQQANNEKATLSKTNEGEETGKKFANEVGEKTEGWCLVICAGMNYAYFLEAGTSKITPRDVLTSAEQYAMQHSDELAHTISTLLIDTLGELGKRFKSAL